MRIKHIYTVLICLTTVIGGRHTKRGKGCGGRRINGRCAGGYLQGLIQTAAALVKWREVEKLGDQALVELERVDGQNPVYMGLRIASFIREAENALAVTEQVDLPLLRLS